MANLRRELLPVLLLALATFGGLLGLVASQPDAHATGARAPRRAYREPVPVRRPPTPWSRPRVQSSATAPAPAVAAVTPPVASAPRPAVAPSAPEGETGEGQLWFGYDGWGDAWEWGFHNWYWRHQRWSYYSRREWRTWLEALRARRARAVRTFLLPGTLDAPSDAPDAPCAVFPTACQGAGGTAPRRAPTPGAPAPRVVRSASGLALDNGEALVSVDPSKLCAVLLDLPGEDRRAVTFALPDAPSSCSVSPWVALASGDPALRITWTGRGYTQDAVVTLAPGAHTPEATVGLVEDVDGARHTVLVNLTDTPRVWTVGTREVSVAPGEVRAR